ncbi:hypothetical protein LUX12_20250 [Streptomyces somaliensis]|nr:hypothetical protein [Streptomyces somaliensis]MCP9946586.1 hypothetical protein [Streptomyces somaliensis]MCP9960279.1 hypothetical protein [Streptomyces somaliensis]MCP9973046.1 hypothetical protein [Streptomyces somaliensis]
MDGGRSGSSTRPLSTGPRCLPTKTIQDSAGLALTTMQYNAQGHVVKQPLPGATGTDAATRVTTHWSATGTGACQGYPEWADLVCSTGPGSAITGGGTTPAQLPTSPERHRQRGAGRPGRARF